MKTDAAASGFIPTSSGAAVQPDAKPAAQQLDAGQARRAAAESAIEGAERLGQVHRQPPAPVVAAEQATRPATHGVSHAPPAWLAAEQRLIDAIAELGRSGTLTYDTYFETVIAQAPKVMVEEHVAWLLGSRDTARQAIANVQERLGDKYACLLLDPGIAYRADAFIAFARGPLRERSDMPALRLRRLFIQSLPVKAYFRGVVLPTSAGEPDVRAPAVRKAVSDLPSAMSGDLEQVSRSKPGESAGLYGQLPMLVPNTTFQHAARLHVFNRGTDSAFFSVSEHPEICWYACCGKESWKDWPPDTELRVTRYEMSSFYALPRTVLEPEIWGRSDPEAKYRVARRSDVFELPLDNPGVEALVSVGLPAAGGVTKTFRPDGDTFWAPSADSWTT